MVDIDSPATLEQRRTDAVTMAVSRAVEQAPGLGSPADPESWTPAIGLCRFAPGHLVLAVAGAVDRAGTEHLRAVGLDLAPLAHAELVIDCSRLSGCDRVLARVLTGLRMRCLIAGARVELHSSPAAVTAELGTRPFRAYFVLDQDASTAGLT